MASKFGLDLEDVAVANLQKTADRWLHLSDGADFFDSAFPPHEQLPRHATFEIVAVEHKGRPASQIFWNGVQVGDILTDASFVADGYRFHDVSTWHTRPCWDGHLCLAACSVANAGVTPR